MSHLDSPHVEAARIADANDPTWHVTLTLSCGCVIDDGYRKHGLGEVADDEWPRAVRCQHGKRKVIARQWHQVDA